MDFDNLNRWAGSDIFKQHVRNIVQNELSWRDIAKNLGLDRRVQNQVDNYLERKLDGSIALGLNRLLPDYLENNKRMDELFKLYLPKVEQKIINVTDRKFKEIIENKENIIEQTYRDSMENRIQNKLRKEYLSKTDSLQTRCTRLEYFAGFSLAGGISAVIYNYFK